MTTNKLVDAIGMIDEKKIKDAKSFTVKSRKKTTGRVVSLTAAVLLCFTLSISALAATVDPIYQILYNISPAVAQALKPVKLSCEDQGIKMEVISSAIYENEALIYISLQDVTGNRIDDTTDLFDSYRINRPFSSTASCSCCLTRKTQNFDTQNAKFPHPVESVEIFLFFVQLN